MRMAEAENLGDEGYLVVVSEVLKLLLRLRVYFSCLANLQHYSIMSLFVDSSQESA